MLDESVKNLKLENIEEAIINEGVAGARKAISLLRSIHDSGNSPSDISDLIKKIENLSKTISSRTLNFIATNESYKKQIKEWNGQKTRNGTKEISDTSQSVSELIIAVEDQLNKSILRAKRSDIKLKRQHEKKIVSNFYKTNKNELKKIFDLQNLIIRAKIGINKSK